MRPTVWLKPGILLVFGASMDAESHQHNAVQLIVPVNNTRCYLSAEGREVAVDGAAIVNAQIPHKLMMDEGWVLLVEPQSDLGQAMCKLLAETVGDRGVMSVSDQAIGVPDSLGLSGGQKSLEDVIPSLAPVLNALTLEPFFTRLVAGGGSGGSLDKRIQLLLSMLDECFQEGFDRQMSWSALDVAKQLSLSEGRFLHLFRQEMVIPWRPYLLWRRMMCAVNALISGVSATDAAHLAGFSDSAHLSRTFRRLFGMSIRQALGLFKKN